MSAIDLSQFNFVVAVDKSSSMNKADCRRGDQYISRIAHVREQAVGLSYELADHDKDGISLAFFSSAITTYENVKASEVEAKFPSRCSGSTDTTEAFQWIVDQSKGSTKPVIGLIITDGEPDDKRSLEKAIKDAGDSAAPGSLKVVFIQVGHDAESTAHLATLNDIRTKEDIIAVMTSAEADKFDSLHDLIDAALAG